MAHDSRNEIGTFLSALARVYRAPANTVAAYRGDLADFRRFLGDVAVEIIITADQIRKYVARIPHHEMRQRRLAGIKRFFRHLEIARRLDNPTRRMRLPKRDQRLPSVLSEKEVEHLIGGNCPG